MLKLCQLFFTLFLTLLKLFLKRLIATLLKPCYIILNALYIVFFIIGSSFLRILKSIFRRMYER